jgi:signal transduction histidine kinase
MSPATAFPASPARTSSRQWLIPLGLAMAGLVVAGAALGPVGFAADGPGLLNGVAAAAFAVAAVPYLFKDRLAPLAYAALMAAMAAGVVGLRAADPSADVTALFLLAAFAPLRPPRLALPAIALLAACAVNVLQLGSGQTAISLILATNAGAAFFFLVGVLLRTEREQRERIGGLLRELEAGRDAERAAAAAAERGRMAREMHDVLAHTLSGLSLHLEGSRLLARTTGADPQLSATIDRASALARAGLSEARRAVRALRDDQVPGPELLDSLIDQHRLASTGQVACTILGTPASLPPDAALAVYRTAQEALSNVRKHAPGADVDVELVWEPAAVRLMISNTAAPRPLDAGTVDGGPPQTADAGFGLSAMAERARLAGGEVEAGPQGAGFRVRLVIPVEAAPEV